MDFGKLKSWGFYLVMLYLLRIWSEHFIHLNIFCLSLNGEVSTIGGGSGSGSTVFGSSDDFGTYASFGLPMGVAVDISLNVYVTDYGNCVIRVLSASTGLVSTVAGTGFSGQANGFGTKAQFSFPLAIVVDAIGSRLLISDLFNHVIRSISMPSSEVSTFAGIMGKLGDTGTQFADPCGLFLSSNRDLYVADYGNNQIKLVSPSGVISTVASEVVCPNDLVVDAAGNIYVTNTCDNNILKIHAGSLLSTVFAGSNSGGDPGYADGFGTNALFSYPQGITCDSSSENLIVADGKNNAIRIISVTTAEVSTLAGSLDGLSGNADGMGTYALFQLPASVAMDIHENIYVADYFNNIIRKISGFSFSKRELISNLRRGPKYEAKTSIKRKQRPPLILRNVFLSHFGFELFPSFLALILPLATVFALPLGFLYFYYCYF